MAQQNLWFWAGDHYFEMWLGLLVVDKVQSGVYFSLECWFILLSLYIYFFLLLLLFHIPTVYIFLPNIFIGSESILIFNHLRQLHSQSLQRVHVVLLTDDIIIIVGYFI